MTRFKAKLMPVSHGGQYVVVPAAIAEGEGLKTHARVRGTVGGAPYRSSLAKYSGTFHLGIHKAALAQAGITPGARVELTIEADDEPLPTDVLPDDFAAAMATRRGVTAAWERLAPSHKREFVGAVLDAKKPETRARRIEKAIERLVARTRRTPSQG